eukprot:gene8553-33986_t
MHQHVQVIEKDAVFQRLVEDRIFNQLPCVVVTSKGMPDLATRAFCAHLLQSCPLICLGLVDWNPSGVAIMRTYKYGSRYMGLESHRYALTGLKWLGIRSCMMGEVEADAMQTLTPRDRSMITTLSKELTHSDPEWVEELKEMDESGYKLDIEAVYDGVGGFQGLSPMLATAILRNEYV